MCIYNIKTVNLTYCVHFKVHSGDLSSSEVTVKETPKCRWISLWAVVIFFYLLVIMLYYHPWNSTEKNGKEYIQIIVVKLSFII